MCGELRDWYDVAVGNDSAPKYYYSGRVYGHKEYQDGRKLKTGYIIGIVIANEHKIITDTQGKQWILYTKHMHGGP